MKEYYSVIDAAKLAGITRRQLDYWVQTFQLIEPAITAPRGKAGAVKLFDFDNLFQLRIFNALLDAGVTVQMMRKITHDDQEKHVPVERPIVSSSKSGLVKLNMAEIIEAFKRKELLTLPVLTNDGLVKIELEAIHEELEREVAEHNKIKTNLN